ncbi:hypothetical protein T439DRAFT_379066 [Meredithblackwellia eburnea MCA 4105]
MFRPIRTVPQLFKVSASRQPVQQQQPLFHLGPDPAQPVPPSQSRFPTSFARTGSSALFSTSTPHFASEAPQSPFESPFTSASVPLFDRLQAHPEALDAIQRLSAVLKTKTGVDLQGGQKPTMMMMMKLAQDPELREAAENLMGALREAGIQIDPKQALEALKTIGNGEFDSLGLESDPKSGRGGDEEGGDGRGKS